MLVSIHGGVDHSTNKSPENDKAYDIGATSPSFDARLFDLKVLNIFFVLLTHVCCFLGVFLFFTALSVVEIVMIATIIVIEINLHI